MSTGPWFVRRTMGVGWRPASWQGWVITLFAVVAAVTVAAVSRIAKAPLGILGIAGILALYWAVAATTSRFGSAAGPAHATPVATHNARDSAPAVRVERAAVVSAAPQRSSSPPQKAGPPALIVEGLTKRFGNRVACQDVSFSVDAGEVFGFLGPNGAGKTTTVRTLATLIAPTAGSASVAGIDLLPRNGEAIRQRISVMPESPGLYLRLSVWENLEFFAGLFRVDNPRSRIHEALDAVNLAPRKNDLCGSLSKGLRQRVALARALLNDPAVLFLDEPTSGLDPVATREVNELINSLRHRGVTVFLTTHRLEEAERLCDRVAILNTTLRMVGRPDEMRSRLFTRALVVTTAAPLPDPATVFGAVNGVDRWNRDGAGHYVLTVADPAAVAPDVTRALVAASADVQAITESQHSLEDVYLELISGDGETQEG